MLVHEAIAAAIELSGLTRTEVASRLGVGLSVVSEYASGRPANPGTDMIARIAEATGCLIVPAATNGEGRADCWVVRRGKLRVPKAARR